MYTEVKAILGEDLIPPLPTKWRESIEIFDYEFYILNRLNRNLGLEVEIKNLEQLVDNIYHNRQLLKKLLPKLRNSVRTYHKIYRDIIDNSPYLRRQLRGLYIILALIKLNNLNDISKWSELEESVHKNLINEDAIFKQVSSFFQ